MVTAGIYLVSERVRGEVIPTVVDVDRAEDVAVAEALANAVRAS